MDAWQRNENGSIQEVST